MRLFLANEHSRPLVFTPVSNAAEIGTAHKVAREFYGFKTLTSFWKPDTRNDIRNLVISGKSNVTPNRIFLKMFRQGLSEERILTMIAAIDHCVQNNIPVPRIIKTSYGKTVIRFVDEKETLFYSAFDYLEGSYYRGTKDELIEMGYNLSNLHAALLRFPEQQVKEQKTVLGFDVPEHLHERIRNMDAPTDPFESLITDEKEFILQEIERLRALLPEIQANATRQVVHRDLHPHNTLFDPNTGKLLAIYDFEQLCYSELIRCLAFTLHRFVRQYIVYNNFTEEQIPDQVKFATELFIESYLSKSGIDNLQIKFIPGMIALEHMARVFIVLNLRYGVANSGMSTYNNADELRKQITSIKEAYYFHFLAK